MTQQEFMVNITDNKNLVNEDILYFKEKDYSKILELVEIISKSIEIIPEIQFVKVELLNDEYQINKLQRNIPIENSRLIKLRIHFKIVDEDGNIRVDDKTKKELRPTIDLLIPRLINGAFQIFDVNYYCMLQILDYKSLVRENAVTIKTLINKQRLEVKKSRRRLHKVELELFRRKDMPLWLILFTMYNPIDAIKRVFKTDNIIIEDMKTDENNNVDDTNTICIGNLIIRIPDLQQSIIDNKEYEYSIKVMFDSLKEFVVDKNIEKHLLKLINDETIRNIFLNTNEYFIPILGSYYTSNVNKYITKGNNVLHSLSRFLDPISKDFLDVTDTLDMYIKELEKINVHNIALEKNTEDTLIENQVNNLVHKRVRLSEYVLFPFIKKLSDNLHVVLNSMNKDVNRINKILNIFKIDPWIVVTGLLSNSLVRYNDQANLLNAISSTRASFITNENTKNISSALRMVHPSFVGICDIISSPSGSSAGLTISLSATKKNMIDDQGRFLI